MTSVILFCDSLDVGKCEEGNMNVWSYPVEFELQINNTIPEAVIQQIIPLKPLESDSISFEGYGTESIGSIIEYQWESDLDGLIGNKSTFISNLSGGFHIITLKVRDDEGSWSIPVTKKYWVNDIPLSSIQPGYSEVVNINDTLILIGVGEDLGGIHHFIWESDVDGNIGYESSLIISNLTSGIHNISFQVMDNETIWSEKIVVTIKINEYPDAAAGEDMYSLPYLSVQFNGHGNDIDGNIVKYEWDFNGDGYFDWSGTEFGLAHFIFNEVGNYTAIFRVTDNDGAQSTDSLYVNVTKDLAVFFDKNDENFIPGFTLSSIISSITLGTLIGVITRRRKT